MIVLSGVSKSYFGQPQILDQVHLELKKGDFFYVVGGSGAGKSTLLRLLATEEGPTSGTVSLFGYNIQNISPGTLRAIRRSIGYVPQNVRIIPDLSVYENVALSLSLSGKSQGSAQDRGRISELLHRLGLDMKRDHLASTLSGGESQRVAVARALVRTPEIIIADEPTGAQDRDYTWSLMDLFLKLNATGSTVIVATHDREIVRRVRKKCAVLRSGQIAVEEALCTF